MADRSLSLVLVKVDDKEAYNRVAEQITTSPYYHNPQVKCETESSGIGSFLDAYRDLLWGMRWLLDRRPAWGPWPWCLANAISISVRERRTEMAVLKVLGFRPGQILLLVMGEAVLLGLLAGFASAALTYMIINWCFHGLSFPMGFFPVFMIPARCLVVGPGGGRRGRLGRQPAARLVGQPREAGGSVCKDRVRKPLMLLILLGISLGLGAPAAGRQSGPLELHPAQPHAALADDADDGPGLYAGGRPDGRDAGLYHRHAADDGGLGPARQRA